MKKIYTLFLALILAGNLMAQTPQSFKYQAVARDAGGDVVAGKAVGMQISILQGSITGTAVYVETFMPTTNGFGLINLNIGAGTVVSGDLTTIDWSADTYFIKIEMDITGGTTYEEYGTSRLLSVPYALHAKTAANTFSGNYSDLSGAPINVSTFTNDAGYLTFFTETDPVFGAHAANGITSTNITNWTTAYGWGDHSTVGYTTTDTTLNEAEVDAFVDNNGYLTNETDPVFGAHIVNGITLTDTANWNAAYGWGDHSILGYFATGGEAGGTNRTLGNTDNYSLGFKTNDATRLFITNDGNVGIGITSPLTKLHIMETGVPNFARLIIQSTDDGAGIRLKSDVGYHCYLDFSDGDSDYVGRIYYSHNDDQMRFRTAGSDAMTINSAGSVGIGTTSPSERLSVTGKIESTTGGFKFPDGTIQTTASVSSTTYSIGDFYQGGIIFWLDASGKHGLIAATTDQSTGIQWYNGSYTTTGATLDAVYAGKANTDLIINNQGSGSYAAHVCDDYSVTINFEYYDDWYLPSKYELNLMYLEKAAIGDFASDWYWSSNEYNTDNNFAYAQYFGGGNLSGVNKSIAKYVRAIRAF